eukprot:2658882-Rhodomonas_salina.3
MKAQTAAFSADTVERTLLSLLQLLLIAQDPTPPPEPRKSPSQAGGECACGDGEPQQSPGKKGGEKGGAGAITLESLHREVVGLAG